MNMHLHSILLGLAVGLTGIGDLRAEILDLPDQANVVLIGNGLGSRMMAFGHFETQVQLAHPTHKLTIRNLCDEGNTLGFRPHSGRPSPWAFKGAEQFYPRRSDAKDRWGSGHTGAGTFAKPDEWLSRLKADVIIAFFGFGEATRTDLTDTYRVEEELDAFIAHITRQQDNRVHPVRLVLVSPIAIEDHPSLNENPIVATTNAKLALMTTAMAEAADRHDLPFINLYQASLEWYAEQSTLLTRDGLQLTDLGYRHLAKALVNQLGWTNSTGNYERTRSAVLEKNWMWHKLFKIPNGVHVFGRRHRPFGPDNYPHELKKLDQLTANRDQAIWATLAGTDYDLTVADKATHPLPSIKTNYRLEERKTGSLKYLYGSEALATMKVASGYQIDLFASEKEFPDLANPVQMSFDNRGRLWVSTMPSYPHYQPGDAKPNDKLIILEDLDHDGYADKQTVFADNLHLPTGFELAPEGVYLAQGTHLMLLRDTDHDGRADRKEIILSGFDDHDTHHVISAFCADPSGAIFMGEGTFLHSNVETVYGVVRSSNGGFFRYSPQRHHLERVARLSIPNPWGTAFDDWGQPFFIDTSDPNLRWMTPGTVNVGYGEFAPNPPSLIENAHRVRPTSGLEFVSSRHFPDDVQGDILLHNTIGFLGTKQHTIEDDGTGYSSRHRQDLLVSSDRNFRPVDLEFAPDGSLYLLDWHNVLVGHMQHSARDPLRDHVHGRVYRITYPSRPLLEPALIEGAPLSQLLENLKLPEYRTRYRTRRELRGRPKQEVLNAVGNWLDKLTPSDERYEHHLVEALWVTWGFNEVNEPLLKRLLGAADFRARSAAVQVLRYSRHLLGTADHLLIQAATDPHGRVRHEAVAAASWFSPETAKTILAATKEYPKDPWLNPVIEATTASLEGRPSRSTQGEAKLSPTKPLGLNAMKQFELGADVYRREGHCITCHQEDGLGLPAAHFPPLAGTKWVNGDPTRLIKLTLHGLMGPIEVKGKTYPGLVPMTAFKGLSDKELAAVLTYVRNTFGNSAPPILPDHVSQIRDLTRQRASFFNPSEL